MLDLDKIFRRSKAKPAPPPAESEADSSESFSPVQGTGSGDWTGPPDVTDPLDATDPERIATARRLWPRLLGTMWTTPQMAFEDLNIDTGDDELARGAGDLLRALVVLARRDEWPDHGADLAPAYDKLVVAGILGRDEKGRLTPVL
jgi:hypothetical protein